jgi:hypothetical protein
MIRLRHKLLILALRALDQVMGAAWLLIFMTRAEIAVLVRLPIPSPAPFQTFYCIVILAAFAATTVVFHHASATQGTSMVNHPVSGQGQSPGDASTQLATNRP